MSFAKLVFLLYFLTNMGMAYGQIPIVTISPTDGTVDKSMPFDQPFILRIPYKSNKIISVDYFELKGTNDIPGSLVLRTMKADSRGREFQPNSIPKKKIYYKKVDKINYTYIKFDYPNLLKPGKRYGLLTSTDNLVVFIDFLLKFDKIFDSLSDSAKLNSLKKQYTSQFKPLIAKNIINGKDVKVYYNNFPERYFDSPIFRSELRKYIQSKLSSSIKKIDNLNSLISSNTTKTLDSFIGISNALGYPSLGQKDKILSAYYFNDTTVFQKSIAWWKFNESKTTLTNLLYGQQKYLSPISKKKLTIAERLNNLSKSIELLEAFYAQIAFLSANFTGYTNIQEALGHLISSVKINHKLLGQNVKSYKKAISVISKEIFEYMDPEVEGKNRKTNFRSSASVYALNSYVGSFEVRNKLTIIPDISFGVLNPLDIDNGVHEDLNYRYLPNLGFSIGLQPINRDVLFKTYDKNLLQRTTIDIGWSLVNFSKEDQYDNFFEKSAFYTGLGFRFSNVIRLQAGFEWINKINVDLDKRELKTIPFLGISADLSIKDLINGFSDVIGGLKGPNIDTSATIIEE